MADHVNFIDWRTHPFRSDRWLEIYRPALDRALAFGATVAYLTRNHEDPLHFRQVTHWTSREDFERYWASDEITALREEAVNYFNKPVLPVWHTIAAEARGDAQAGATEAVPAEAGD